MSQAGYRAATISVIENQLRTDESGSIAGDLVCRCLLPSGFENKFICRIEQSDKVDLLEIPAKTKLQVSYRDHPPLSILPREDPYAMFIYTKLGFSADEVIGQINSADHNVVLIRQNDLH